MYDRWQRLGKARKADVVCLAVWVLIVAVATPFVGIAGGFAILGALAFLLTAASAFGLVNCEGKP